LKPAQANSSKRPYLEKTLHKKGLMEWLKVKALRSSPNTSKRKKTESRRMTQVVGSLHRKCKTLSSTPVLKKIQKTKPYKKRKNDKLDLTEIKN
jgi:hypothetical protein